MRARMYDAVEVKVKIVHLLAIWIGLRSVNGILHAIDLVGLLLNHGRDNLGILLGKPSEKSWDTHRADLRETERAIENVRSGRIAATQSYCDV